MLSLWIIGVARLPRLEIRFTKEDTMTRLESLVSCAAIALSVSLAGCGSNGSSTTPQDDAATAATALSAVPKANEVPGWTIDPSNDKTSGVVAATSTTEKGVEAFIDGAAADFFNGFTPVLFAWQNYVNTTLPVSDVPNGATLALYVLQMPDAAQASGLYTSLASASLYVGKTWVDPSAPVIGLRSRMTDTGDHWWINFYKGNFYVEVNLFTSQGPAPDYKQGLESTKTAAIAFAQAIAAKI
jgi:predicted small lipoprotein YifL